MRRKTRTKVKKYLIITGSVIGIILLIIGVIFLVKLTKKPTISYRDGLVDKNYFCEITIDMNTKEVKRDNQNTTLSEEFGVTEEKENQLFASEEEMTNFLSDSVFDIKAENGIFTIKNPYQTKCIIVKAKEIKETTEGEEVTRLSDNLYLLSFFSEKMTKVMYDFYKEKPYIEKIFYDDVFIDNPLSDISQTMYGENQVDLGNYHSLGTISMGLDKYAGIINENGNPSDITIATIGYGFNNQNELFNDRISEDSYNFVLNNKDLSETIPQGSRIAEILVNSTTSNVKLMNLVTVNSEGYILLSNIVRALSYALEKSDVICYELINTDYEALDILLEEAFKKNVPVCVVTGSGDENYPANHPMTIATSSVDRDFNFSDYSGQGDYIDFAASSTDVEEIFNVSSATLRWSGPEYSNAHIVSSIALIKSYAKDATILEIYNFMRNYCRDLGEERKG